MKMITRYLPNGSPVISTIGKPKRPPRRKPSILRRYWRWTWHEFRHGLYDALPFFALLAAVAIVYITVQTWWG